MHRDVKSTLSFILQPHSRYVITWIVAVLATAGHATVAWHSYDTARHRGDPAKARADGNFGHTLIDFAGQWVMARILVTGHGHELYHRAKQREIIDAAFPRSDEAPQPEASDADNLYGWMIDLPPEAPGRPAIGGALYPPTHALLFAPLGTLSPRSAYRITQLAVLILAWLCGWLMSLISERRIWWPVATLLIFGYPGFLGTLHLAQNSILSLTLLTSGWLLATRQRPIAAGTVWGLLVYKPTWLVAFALVPLLTRRWRMLAGMVGCAIALGLATLPLVGIEPWFDWLRVGRAAANFYALDENWVFLSRDLLNVPRRWILDFAEPMDTRDRWAATIAGWTMWGVVLATTAVLSLRRRISAPTGFGPAFVGIGAWLSCFHFIYYDSLLSALPVFLVFTRAQWRPPWLNLPPFVLAAVVFLIVYELAFAWLSIDVTITLGFLTPEGSPPTKWLLSTKQVGTPWDTLALLALWGYCGVRTLMTQLDHDDTETG